MNFMQVIIIEELHMTFYKQYNEALMILIKL